MPFEYCEWNPLFKKCKANFEANYAKHFPEVEGDEALARRRQQPLVSDLRGAATFKESKPACRTRVQQMSSGRGRQPAAAGTRQPHQ